MKILMKFRALTAMLAAALVVGGAFAQTPSAPTTATPLTKETKDEVMKEVNRIVTSVAFVPGVDFSKWNDFIDGEKASLDKADNPGDFVLAVNMALRKFGVSHIVMATPEMATMRRTQKAVGIGVQIQPEVGKGIRVVNVFPESPAALAGIHPGDLIVQANGKKVDNPADMQGAEGTTVEIKVDRDTKIKTFKIVRKTYSNKRPETLTWVNPTTSVLKIWTFDAAYDQNNVEKLISEASKGRNLIVDMRSNPGGQVTNLIHLMGLLMPERSPIGTFIQRTMVDRYVKETGGKATDLEAIAKFADRPVRAGKPDIDRFKGNIAVLVNGASGSAAEIAAAALQEVIDAPVIGSKSAGAVLVSIMGPLPKGYMLQYPVTDFVTPKGMRLEGHGVEPILETPAVVKFGEKDTAIDKAVLLLQRIDLRQDRSGK